METALQSKRLIEKLNEPNTADELAKVLDRLPSIVDKLEKMDQLLTAGEKAMGDHAATEKLKMKLDHINIDLDTIESGMKLIEKLPFILHVANRFEQAAIFAEDVLKDEKSVDYLFGQAEGYVKPIKERIDNGRNIWEKVKNESDNNGRQITVFTMIKWLKEPRVQRFLSYVQAYINIIQSQDNRKEE